MKALGIDVGGSGIKGAPIDLNTGKLLEDRFRIPTPQPAKVKDMLEVMRQIVEHFKWEGPIGVGFPAVIKNGVAKTAANIANEWIGRDVASSLKELTNCPTYVTNDADAAGIAEMTFGEGKNNDGLVLIITVGTGIGTAFFNKGVLMPNSEFGHVLMNDERSAEKYTSDATRKKYDLAWDEWAVRFNKYLNYIENLFWPDLIILGGGASKKYKKYKDYLETRTTVVPAKLLNEAGIIGAALSTKFIK